MSPPSLKSLPLLAHTFLVLTAAKQSIIGLHRIERTFSDSAAAFMPIHGAGEDWLPVGAAAQTATTYWGQAPTNLLSTGDTTVLHDAPSQDATLDVMKEEYLNLLADALTGTLSDEAGACVETSAGGCSSVTEFVPADRENGKDWPPWGHTMVGLKRLKNVRMAIEDTVKNNVPGDFAELGVWRGGASIYAKAIYNLEGQANRKVHAFDAFDSVPVYGKSSFAQYLSVPQEVVKHSFEKYKVLDENVKFHQGLFKDTVPAFSVTNPNTQLAVLRIDGNYYDSYQDALYYLYEKVPVGGYVIFDDYYADGNAGQAWRDFKADNGVPEMLTKIDDNGAFLKKTADVKVDMTRMKAPQDVNKAPSPVKQDGI